MELFGIRCFVEVEVSCRRLVRRSLALIHLKHPCYEACKRTSEPPKISSAPSPLRTIFTPEALHSADGSYVLAKQTGESAAQLRRTKVPLLILRAMRYIGVDARTVVTSKVSKW